ncbi:Na/Pi cotransporter family protein [Dysgonomonas sp. 216]|uniref:Na/Pi cotransporter family protein n=1 Tax=Dysgonomonas sp. 216 TaxID=2302934 RepID=UPI0013D74A2D|nr:Na/Pi cotransporter family protein [Dysgonomonas sp. 216]NDW18803.1 Na/Pi cotransporter family protein [Dysgonomonas sp. 216]
MEYTFFDFMLFLGSMALFLYGMKIMSEGLQKLAGDRLRNILTAMTKNRVTAVLTGLLVTAVIQSSSATTVMVVSFVNAGLLTLTQSISVILGANIGTTLTAWIISVFGFKVDISTMTLPILAIAIPLIFSGKSSRKSLGEFIFGFAFLFMGLAGLKENVPDLASNPGMLEFVTRYTDMGFGSIILFFFIGALLTVVVQSSSATMAITLIMCAQGWISYEIGAAIVLGENLGTTMTANLAALTANTSARRAALSHFMFNMFGVVWVLALFYPFTSLVSNIVDSLVTGDVQTIISFKLSAFHTCYNICNTFIFIWLVSFLEKVVTKLIPQKEEEEEFRLKFIQSGMLSTSELSMLQARQEINLFSSRMKRMFAMVRELLHEKNDSAYNRLFSRIEKYENISDNMELEIANYLNQVSEGRLSSESKTTIRLMLKEVTEIESIGDSCYNIARTITRKKQSNLDFTESQYANITEMFDLIDSSLDNMQHIIERQISYANSQDVNKAFNLESEINNLRNQLKNSNLLSIDNKEYSYELGVIYMDIIGDCEKLADYVVNVVEVNTEPKEPKRTNI